MTTAALPLPGGGGASTSVDVIMWVGALIVAVTILGIVILIVRRRIYAKDAESVLWLDELRAMHTRGEISTEEYDAARKAYTTRIASKLGKDGSPSPQPAARPRPAPGGGPPAPGELRARPGFDLTGAPLPNPNSNPIPKPPEAPPPGPYDRKPKG